LERPKKPPAVFGSIPAKTKATPLSAFVDMGRSTNRPLKS
jgi:hypothetical protein